MKKFLVLALLICTTVFGANVKVFGGANFTQTIADSDGNKSDLDVVMGYQGGVELHTKLGDMFEVGAGLKYNTPLTVTLMSQNFEFYSVMPIYLSGKLVFGDAMKLYLQGMGGYSINTLGKDLKEFGGEVKSGVFYGAGLGVEIGGLCAGVTYDISTLESGGSKGTYTIIGANLGYKIGE